MGVADKIVLGPFVIPEFIGYYSAAMNLVTSSAFLIVLSDVFFPIFVRMKGKSLKRAFNKSAMVTFSMAFLLFLFILMFANPLITLIFGKNYGLSISMLRVLAPLAIFYPMIELYTSYIVSKGKLKKITYIVLLITALSILLPFTLVKLFSIYGATQAVFGIIIGVMVSKAIHLFCLFWISGKT